MVKADIRKSLVPFTKVFTLDKLIHWTGQKQILPFYHTVAEKPSPHIYKLSYYRNLKDFEYDLHFLKQNYVSIPIEKIGIPGQNFHVTFDDGLNDFYSFAMPLLLETGIHATMFVNTDFIDNQKMFHRHKVSLLLYYLDQGEADKLIAAGFLETDPDQIDQKLNVLDERGVDQLAAALKIDLNDYLQTVKPYLTLKQLNEIQERGFVVGNHSKSHPNFSSISFSEQMSQVVNAREQLAAWNMTGKRYFAFPFGDQEISSNFFQWLYDKGETEKSFGISGLKTDGFIDHHHRILMEKPGLSAAEIIKAEYLYYLLKMPFGKNKISR